MQVSTQPTSISYITFLINIGNQLPFHVYKTPYETAGEKSEAVQQLQREYETELQEKAWFEYMGFQYPHPVELKVRGENRRGGIDWFIYRERILNPLLFPFLVNKKEGRFGPAWPGLVYMEDGAPSHKHHYHDLPRYQLGLHKLVWPACSPDLNPIECIWNEIKDKIKARLGPGWDFTAAAIREALVEEWRNYPVERVNMYIESMPRRIEACIADSGGNNFNF